MTGATRYYRHFKGGKYKVLAIGQDSESLKPVVVYQALYGDHKVWVRPKEMFEYLRGYSPLHNLKPGTSYPATLVTTADHDDRVVPAHSFKFAATLQECHQGSNPVLIRIDTKAGHGGGKPLAKVLEEQADIYGFILYNMGVKFK